MMVYGDKIQRKQYVNTKTGLVKAVIIPDTSQGALSQGNDKMMVYAANKGVDFVSHTGESHKRIELHALYIGASS